MRSIGLKLRPWNLRSLKLWDHEAHQISHVAMLLTGMMQLVILTDFVTIAAAVFDDSDVAASGQLVDDALYCTFSDADIGRNLSHANIRLLCNQRQDVAMVGEQSKSERRCSGILQT